MGKTSIWATQHACNIVHPYLMFLLVIGPEDLADLASAGSPYTTESARRTNCARVLFTRVAQCGLVVFYQSLLDQGVPRSLEDI